MSAEKTTWYKAIWGNIEEVIVVRETECFVEYENVYLSRNLGRKNIRKEKKRCSYFAFFKTRSEAKDWIISGCEDELRLAKATVNGLIEKLEKAKEL